MFRLLEIGEEIKFDDEILSSVFNRGDNVDNESIGRDVTMTDVPIRRECDDKNKLLVRKLKLECDIEEILSKFELDTGLQCEFDIWRVPDPTNLPRNKFNKNPEYKVRIKAQL